MSAAATGRAPATTGVLPYWSRQGGETLAEAMQIISDLTAQEVALIESMLRERMSVRPAASTMETAGDALRSFADAGKILLDLAADESAVFTDALKQALSLRPGLAALVDLIPRGMGTLTEMQKNLLDMMMGQTREVVEAYKESKPLMTGARLSKMTRQTFESFVETQKVFLDQIAEQVSVATQDKETKASPQERSTIVNQLAREGVEKFIDAQRALLKLAMESIEASERVRVRPEPRTSLAVLARESVQNFTTAQKSLLDLALRPIAGPVEVEEEKKSGQERAHQKAEGPGAARRAEKVRGPSRTMAASGAGGQEPAT
ncbi:MAG: hypothetical protein ACM3S5_01195 [Rhodospirillales bacterium]